MNKIKIKVDMEFTGEEKDIPEILKYLEKGIINGIYAETDSNERYSYGFNIDYTDIKETKRSKKRFKLK